VDYAHRQEREARLARALARLGSAQRRQLLELLGDPPKLENLPPAYWDGMHQEFVSLLTPELESIFVDSAKLLLDSTPAIGVDWSLINRDAADWARGHWLMGGHGTEYQYPLALAVQFTERRKQELARLIPAYYEQSWTMGQLKEKMDTLFGPIWGEMVASTEVTRASVQGELAVAKEAGVEMVAIWQTNADEIVCPLCGPNHSKRQGDGWQEPPPAHPRCRCWINHELVQVEAQ
jgi:hypothetical protein